MVLAQYTDTFWYPSGTLAAGVQIRVFPLDSNILAPLYVDAGGTIPLANPVTTSVGGTIAFYAEEGDYWMHADSETFQISVGGTPPPTELAEVTLSTGVAFGGDITANVSDPTAVDFAAVRAFIVDDVTDPPNPLITEINEPARTVVLDGPAQSRVLTWWLMDADGSLTQQAATPTPQQRRQFVILGRSAFNPVAGAVVGTKSIHTMLQQQANQVADLMEALGPFSLIGNRITPVGSTLQFDKSSGLVFLRSIAHDIDPGNPHEGVTPAQAPAQFRRILQTTTTITPIVNTIDPANYDVGGVVTPVGGGAGSATIQRVYVTPADNTIDQISVQYGQTVYSSLANALDAIGSGVFTPNPGLATLSALIGYIAVIRTATNLADTTQARFVTAGKFATP
jgi:hypothetical protein